jgi:hypothetical protein
VSVLLLIGVVIVIEVSCYYFTYELLFGFDNSNCTYLTLHPRFGMMVLLLIDVVIVIVFIVEGHIDINILTQRCLVL